MIWKFFWCILHVYRTKIDDFENSSQKVKVMILGNLEAAPEEAMQLRGLIKGSNWSLGHYLFGRYEFWKFWPPIAQIPRGGSCEPPPSWSPPKKRPALIGLTNDWDVKACRKKLEKVDELFRIERSGHEVPLLTRCRSLA